MSLKPVSLLDIKKAPIRKTLIFLTIVLGLSQFVLVSHVPASNFLIDSLNANTLHLPLLWSNYFNAPALKTIGVGGRPHAYDTDYGVGALAGYFMKSERVAKEDLVIFVEHMGTYGFASPLQYIMCQKNVSLCKKNFGYTISFLPIRSLDNTDFFIVYSATDYDISDLNDFIPKNMKFVKKISLESNESFPLYDLGGNKSFYLYESSYSGEQLGHVHRI